MSTKPKITDELRRKVASHAVAHGNRSASEKFNVSMRSVASWKKKFAPGSTCADGDAPKAARNADGTFQKGVSGNPEGTSGARQRARRKYAELSCKVAEAYEQQLDAILEQSVDQRDWGQLSELGELINDRGLGKPTQSTEVSGPEGKPMAVVSTADLISQHYGVRPGTGPDIDADLEAAKEKSQGDA